MLIILMTAYVNEHTQVVHSIHFFQNTLDICWLKSFASGAYLAASYIFQHGIILIQSLWYFPCCSCFRFSRVHKNSGGKNAKRKMNNINTAQFSSIETFRDWAKRNGRIRMSVECFDNA